jgi:hypothetical protein
MARERELGREEILRFRVFVVVESWLGSVLVGWAGDKRRREVRGINLGRGG